MLLPIPGSWTASLLCGYSPRVVQMVDHTNRYGRGALHVSHAGLPGGLLVVLPDRVADAAHFLQGVANTSLAQDGGGAQARDLAVEFLQAVPEHDVIAAVQQRLVEALDCSELADDI